MVLKIIKISLKDLKYISLNLLKKHFDIYKFIFFFQNLKVKSNYIIFFDFIYFLKKNKNKISFFSDKKYLNTFKKNLFNFLKVLDIFYLMKLEIVGLGYKIKKRNSNLLIDLGFSHCVVYKIPNDIKIEIRKKKIFILGLNKEVFYKTIKEIVNIRKINIYKIKGIKILKKIYKIKSGKKKR